MPKKYDQQGLFLLTERTPHTDTKRYDIKISSRFEMIQAFSLDEKELNTVEKALNILENKRYGVKR